MPAVKWQTRKMRHWKVAGALLQNPQGLLLVANRRRNGSLDWTPPGGVVDEGETPLEALRREVIEETGLRVDQWGELAYTVEVAFTDRDMLLQVEVHRAHLWSGEFIFEDPDGIVEEARFVQQKDAGLLLKESPLWVQEPVSSWLTSPQTSGAHFSYKVRKTSQGELRVERQ